MKKLYLFIILIITILLEIILTINIINKQNYHQNNPILINELIKEIETNYSNIEKYPKTLEYTILDETNNIVYQTNNDISTSLNEAYKNKDTIINFSYEENKQGTIIVYNNFKQTIKKQNQLYINTMITTSLIQVLIMTIYYIYLNKTILKPFKKMNEFAERIAEGNLDIPLQMDKQNNFGAFTEAFDIMRYEIKKAREAEQKANNAKKELVAQLSHDIKTPISSIKSYCELGIAIKDEQKIKEYLQSINNKSDQMNTLVTNLFNTTLEELEELNINPETTNSKIIEKLLSNADYLEKNKIIKNENCNIYVDKLRLQQVFDNIISNSYKYANTKIETSIYKKNDYLIVEIKDFGTKFNEEEIPLLTEKFKRGSNTKNIEGTGLGLYISKELMKKMNGNLEIENANPGFKVKVYLRII